MPGARPPREAVLSCGLEVNASSKRITAKIPGTLIILIYVLFSKHETWKIFFDSQIELNNYKK